MVIQWLQLRLKWPSVFRNKYFPATIALALLISSIMATAVSSALMLGLDNNDGNGTENPISTAIITSAATNKTESPRPALEAELPIDNSNMEALDHSDSNFTYDTDEIQQQQQNTSSATDKNNNTSKIVTLEALDGEAAEVESQLEREEKLTPSSNTTNQHLFEVPVTKKQLEIIHDQYKNDKHEANGGFHDENDLDSVMNRYYGSKYNFYKNYGTRVTPTNYYNYRYPYHYDDEAAWIQRYRTFQPVTYHLINLQSQQQRQQTHNPSQSSLQTAPQSWRPYKHQQVQPIIETQLQSQSQPKLQPESVVQKSKPSSAASPEIQGVRQYKHKDIYLQLHKKPQHQPPTTAKPYQQEDDIFVDGYIRPQSSNNSSSGSTMMIRMYQFGDEHFDGSYDDDEYISNLTPRYRRKQQQRQMLKCRYCGGYSSDVNGDCCKYCGILKFDGCWCKP